MSAYALSGSNLVSFDQTNPTVGTTIPITGLTLGDTLVGIDFRPQNGFLYGLGVGGGPAGSAQLYATRHKPVRRRRLAPRSPLSMRAAIRSLSPVRISASTSIRPSTAYGSPPIRA
jgi:Domain of unknown function (DUF4394)